MSATESFFPAAQAMSSAAAVDTRFAQSLDALRSYHDRFFSRLLVAQWAATILLAVIVSPRTWTGAASQTHAHVWAAILLGGGISLFPAWLGWKRPGLPETRHAIAAGQMLMSALLIHLTGGRIETHFHVFGSLAFLAFYRDVRVLVTATVIVYVDHLLRGMVWPESVYGVLVATPWRSIEHGFWVLFEVGFLTLSIRRGLDEMREVARRQLTLESVNESMERAVRERTHALAESEARFRALFQHVPIGLYRAAPDGELQLANPAMLTILGYASVEEMRANRELLQGSPLDIARHEFFRQIVKDGAVEGRDTVWIRRDGSKVAARENARAVRGPDGEIQHIDGSAEDITERRQLEERYQQAQKVQAIGQLAGGIAHDFNNVLTAVSGFADLALTRPGITSDIRRCVLEIRKASDRAASLTHQMLAFSRKQTLQPRVLDLNHLVTDLERMLRRIVGEHIQIDSRLAAKLVPVKVDPSQMQQVILNLVVNARDAMLNGGRLVIETSTTLLDEGYARLHPGAKPGRYVLLSVSDTGTGMTPEIRTRLFEPFFTTKAPGTGTGLGLATCHGIVTQSGGLISVYSEVGLGSTFKVFLPAVDQTVDSPSASPFPTQPGSGHEIVLLVEDEQQVRELASEVLASLGYQVITAANGREALQYCTEGSEQPVNIIVTDVVMPEMDGRELARRARQHRPGMPVIFTSGFTFDTIQPDDMQKQGQFFLSKPYAMTELAQKVRQALDRQRVG